MSIFEARKDPLVLNVITKVTYFLILSILVWFIGAPSFVHTAKAAQISGSDTVSNSNISWPSRHTIVFTPNTLVATGTTIKIQLDPVNSLGAGYSGNFYTETYSGASSTDIAFLVDNSPWSLVSTCTTGNQVTATGTYNNASDENLTFYLCPGAATIATTSVIKIVVGSSTTLLWTNPASTTSTFIRISGTSGVAGDLEVATLPTVAVTAAVDSTFTFTVTGLATSSQVSSTTQTTGSTTPTLMNFGLMRANASSTLGQQLKVVTNARGGFAVTVQADKPLTDSAGQSISFFDNGDSTSTARTWRSPFNTLNVPATYGHFGLTSTDWDGGNTPGEFQGDKYVGNFASTSPHQVFYNAGPSNGVASSTGWANVGYTLEVGSLQPAGTDYSNTLMYIATPTF